VTRANVTTFLLFQAFAAFVVVFLVGSYRLKLVPERARRSQKILFLMFGPPMVLLLEVIAFSLLFTPNLG
jgi:hypothetical protein